MTDTAICARTKFTSDMETQLRLLDTWLIRNFTAVPLVKFSLSWSITLWWAITKLVLTEVVVYAYSPRTRLRRGGMTPARDPCLLTRMEPWPALRSGCIKIKPMHTSA